MQKTENPQEEAHNNSYRELLGIKEFDFERFDEQLHLMSVLDQLSELAAICPIKLNYTLMSAFALYQDQNPRENCIKTLAVFTELLMVVHVNLEVIQKEAAKVRLVHDAFDKLHGRS